MMMMMMMMTTMMMMITMAESNSDMGLSARLTFCFSPIVLARDIKTSVMTIPLASNRLRVSLRRLLSKPGSVTLCTFPSSVSICTCLIPGLFSFALVQTQICFPVHLPTSRYVRFQMCGSVSLCTCPNPGLFPCDLFCQNLDLFPCAPIQIQFSSALVQNQVRLFPFALAPKQGLPQNM